jgi:catechol 2,3-dioxygenase-like lactoylglutathione lyase family enzyme
MISGAHVLLYSQDAEADRAFFRDVLGFPSVDAGEGWLIFALPASELGVHPTDGAFRQQLHGGRHLLEAVLYLMCSDLPAYMQVLEAKKVWCSPIEKEPWGIKTTIRLPSGGELGLYQPTHPTALALARSKRHYKSSPKNAARHA